MHLVVNPHYCSGWQLYRLYAPRPCQYWQSAFLYGNYHYRGIFNSRPVQLYPIDLLRAVDWTGNDRSAVGIDDTASQIDSADKAFRSTEGLRILNYRLQAFDLAACLAPI